MADGDEPREWPTWKCTALTGALCAIPLLPAFVIFPVVAVISWAILLLIYVALVRLFGAGFVVEGAVIVLILAVLFFVFAPRFLDRSAPAEEEPAGPIIVEEI